MRVLFYCRGEENPGVGYLSSILKKAGHETGLLFDPGFEDIFFTGSAVFRKLFTPQALARRATRFRPDMVAYSSLTLSYHAVRRLSRMIKNACDPVQIIGGPHATAVAEAVLKEGQFDYAVVGEADKALPELVRLLEESDDPSKAPNTVCRKNGEYSHSPLAPLVEDLDALPFPDKKMFIRAGAAGNRLGILTARNCPFSCTYCSHSLRQEQYQGLGKYYRQRSVENVMDEITAMLPHGFKNIRIWDDIFGIRKEWTLLFLERLKKETGLPFSVTMHVKGVDAEMAKALKAAGCQRVALGIQSGDDQVRRSLLGRRESIEESRQAIRILKAHGLFVLAEVMLGLPGESREQMNRTIHFCQSEKPDNVSAFIYFPMPGTRMIHQALKDGLLPEAVYNRLIRGQLDRASWHRKSLIGIPHAEHAYRWKVLLPLSVKLKKPLRFAEKTQNALVWKVLFFLSMIFVDQHEFRQKIRDYFRMMAAFFLKPKIKGENNS